MKGSVVGIVKENADVYSFYIDPQTKVDYKPGDFIYLILPLMKYSDIKGNIRHFSLSSSPSEDILRVTVKKGLSGYKKTLMGLRVGTNIEIEGPHGVYPWPLQNASGAHVFVAGGIGITPFRSRLKYNLDNKISQPITLLYSNSTPDSMLFRSELELFAKNIPNFKFQPIYSNETGRIDKKMLKKLIKDHKSATFWLTGPVSFVSNIEGMLFDLGMDPDNLKTEKFTGYL